MLLEITALASYDFMLTIALIFLYGRLAHGICFAFYDHNPFLRMSGMITTYLALLIFAIKLVFSVVN